MSSELKEVLDVDKEGRVISEIFFEDKETGEKKIVILRYAKIEDQEGIKNAIIDRYEFRNKKYKVPMPEFREEELRIFQKSFSEPEKCSVVVITVDNKIVGYVEFGIRPELDGDVHRIFTLSVMKYFHRKGFGKVLLERAINDLKIQFGAKKIRLNTQEENEESLPLYLKKGFKQVKRDLSDKRKWHNKDSYNLVLEKDLEEEK